MTAMTLGEGMARLDARADEANAFYAMLKKRGRLKAHRAVAYRCPKRCLLADVLTTAQGIIIHVPAYKLSPKVNEESSSASGRAANTTDGDRRWKAHTFPVEAAINVTCTCDHVHHFVLDVDTIEADVEARRGEVVINS